MSGWTSGYVVDTGYTSGFYRELTPTLLGFVALAKGVRAPDPGRPLAYCELGCGQGFSANLLAAANPDIAVYATDFNPAHIAGARALQSEAGTPDLTLFDSSFAEFLDDGDLPSFDIISLHGIYSWIAAEHRRTIVEIIRRKLKPGGLVYISYNALPGWSVAAPLRQLMYLHVKSGGGPTEARLDPALAFIQRMMDVNAGFVKANPALSLRFDKIKQQNRSYLAHEYLNDSWTLFYHSDVAAELAEAKLSFVGSAALLEHIDAINLTADQQQLMAELRDPVLKETVRDFMINQQFRRDVFLRGQVPHSVQSSREAWTAMRFALSTHRPDVPMTVTGALGEANLQEDTYLPLLDALASGPRTLGDMLAEPRVGVIGWGKLIQAIAILVGAGHVQPCLPAAGETERARRTRAFNAAVVRRAEASAELQFLASPVTGGGIALDRIGQLFLGAWSADHTDPVEAVWSVLSGQGQRLVKDGKTLESADENRAELRRQFDAFVSKRLPVLNQLGIA